MKHVLLSFLLAASAWAYTKDDALNTMQTSNVYADIAAGLAYVYTQAEDGWVVTIGTTGQTVDLGSNQLLIGDGNTHTLTVQGADPSSRTILTTSGNSSWPVWINAGDSKVIKVKDFRVNAFTAGKPYFFWVTGSNQCFQLSNIQVVGNNGNGLAEMTGDFVNGPGNGYGPFGLIDHCAITGTGSVYVRQNLNSPDREWANNHSITWGSNKAVFIERCSFNQDPAGVNAVATDGSRGGRVTVRHNTMTNTSVAWHGRDSTGLQGGACKGSFLMGEVYDNVFTISKSGANTPVFIRGGTLRARRNGMLYSGDGSVNNAMFSFQAHCSDAGNMNGLGEGCLNASDCSVMTTPLTEASWPTEAQYVGTPQVVYLTGNTPAGVLPVAVGSVMTHQDRDYFINSASDTSPEYTYPHPLSPGEVASAPSNAVPPTITGEPAVGQVLTGTFGIFDGYPDPTVTGQWKLCDANAANCVNISGETALNHTPLIAEKDGRVKLCATATNASGSVETCSSPTGTISGLSATNLIHNGTFEQDALGADETNPAQNNGRWANWNVVNTNGGYVVQALAANVKTGNHAVAITKGWNDPANILSVSQTFAVLPSTVYPLTFWSQNDQAGYMWKYSVRDATHNTSITSPTNADHQTYTQTVTTFTTNAGQISATLTFDATNSYTGQFNRLDDVEVVPPAVTPPSPAPAASWLQRVWSILRRR